MHRGCRYLSLLLLAASLAAPVGMMAAGPADNKNPENRQGEKNSRYYHKNHKDYHNWDANEGRAYQRYQAEHNEKRTFAKLSVPQRNVYWDWRHNNPDRP